MIKDILKKYHITADEMTQYEREMREGGNWEKFCELTVAVKLGKKKTDNIFVNCRAEIIKRLDKRMEALYESGK